MRPRAVAVTLLVMDLALAGVTAVTGAVVLLACRVRPSAEPVDGRRRLVALETMYSLNLLRTRQAEHVYTHRDLDGYFDHVWSVHPLVGADPSEPAAAGVGPPRSTPLAHGHTMIEGKTRRSASLRSLPYLNFVLAQVELVLALDRIVRREGVCILRADPYYCGLLALLLGRVNQRAVEVRIVANFDLLHETVGALAYPRLFRWRAVERRVVAFTLGRADVVVTSSADNREFALRNGARPNHLAHIGRWGMVNPVHVSEPAERERVEDEFGLGDRPVVVCVSRLERMKHPEDVVVSVAKARCRHPRIAGLLVGDGAMRAELSELCVELGVEEDVVFAGERDQQWIARMLAHSKVIAAPLAGLALVESALSGTPIVAYDVEWHAELIRPGQDGILVPYRATDAMAAAICALVEDPAEAARLGVAGRARALARMDPAELIAEERALADGVLARAGR